MRTAEWQRATAIAETELPSPVATYLAAHDNRDLDTAISCFTDDASVTDEARTYRGRAEVRAWLARSASEYTYTNTLIGAAKVDDTHVSTHQQLAGDFPGGIVDLHYRFTLRDQSIAELVIEP